MSVIPEHCVSGICGRALRPFFLSSAIIMKKVSTVRRCVNITEQVLTEPIPETLKTLYEGTQMF